MPRTARLDATGMLHHIMIRCVERRKIFRDNEDSENFIDRLSALIPFTGSFILSKREFYREICNKFERI